MWTRKIALFKVIMSNYTQTFHLSGLPLVFSKFFPGIPNFFQVFKTTNFGSIFRLKLNIWIKTVLNSMKTIKRYCKATLNMLF